jgi:ClpX C4-type zinc finger
MSKPPASPPPSSSRSSGQGSAGAGAGGAERCAFCGRREIEAGRLIAGAKAAICADCIRRLGEGLKAERGRRPPR